MPGGGRVGPSSHTAGRRAWKAAEAPWRDFRTGGLNAAKLGKLLAEFEIKSATIRFPGTQAKGYRRTDFEDAWTRYCPEPVGLPSQPSQASPPSSERDGLPLWDASSRPTHSTDQAA